MKISCRVVVGAARSRSSSSRARVGQLRCTGRRCAAEVVDLVARGRTAHPGRSGRLPPWSAGCRRFGTLDLDRVRRAGPRAKLAADALLEAVRVLVEPAPAVVAGRLGRQLLEGYCSVATVRDSSWRTMTPNPPRVRRSALGARSRAARARPCDPGRGPAARRPPSPRVSATTSGACRGACQPWHLLRLTVGLRSRGAIGVPAGRQPGRRVGADSPAGSGHLPTRCSSRCPGIGGTG